MAAISVQAFLSWLCKATVSAEFTKMFDAWHLYVSYPLRCSNFRSLKEVIGLFGMVLEYSSAIPLENALVIVVRATKHDLM
eukprot:885024-Amphidinium_carterae.1